DFPRVIRIAEEALRGKRVFFQPIQELRAVGRNDVRLREMDVRVDEARQDQLAAIVGDRSAGGERAKRLRCWTDVGDMAVPYNQQPVGKVAMRGVTQRRGIADEVEDLA